MSQSATQEATSPDQKNEDVNPDELSSDDKFNALGNERPGGEAETETETPVTPEQPPAEEPGEKPGEKPESTEEKPGEKPEEKKLEEETGEDGKKKGGDKSPERFRLKGPEFEKERKFLELRKQGVDSEAAYKAAYGEKKEGGETQEANPFAEIDAEISKTETEIKDLEAKIEKATEDLDTAEALKLERERNRKERAIEKLQDKKESVKTEQKEKELTAFEQKAVKFRDQAVEEFPALGDKKSEERKEFNAFVEEVQDDPDYADILKSPRWPLILAREFAQEHGLEKKSEEKTETPPKPEESKPEPKATQQPKKKPEAPKSRQTTTAAKVLTSGDDPGEQSTTEATAEELERDLPNMTAKQKEELLGA